MRWHRVLRSLRTGGLLIGLGLCYALLFGTGLHIPCPIHALTGLYCPSCGVSRMCIHLLRGEWEAAARCNLALFCLLPVLALIFGSALLRYWRTGERGLSRWQTAAVWVVIGLLILFGILRNLPPFAILRPID